MKHTLETCETPTVSARLGASLEVLAAGGGTQRALPRCSEELPASMQDFTPYSSLAGGALIGLAASVLLIASGRIAGISGIVSGLLVAKRGERLWRGAFLTGLFMAGAAFGAVEPGAIQPSPRSLLPLVIAGLLVGIGTRVGNGCTSGHGVCGLSRLSVRSLAATATFVGAGILTATLARWLGGGS